MSDTSGTLPLAAADMNDPAQVSDVRVMAWFGTVLLLALVVLLAVLSPFDMASDPQYVPMLFVP